MKFWGTNDPNLGRWLNRDPLKDAEIKEGINLYPYVGNNPINRIDPTGMFWWRLFDNVRGFWGASVCANISVKWRKDCLEKIPACSCEFPPAASTYEKNEIMEKYTACIGERQNKWRECLQGMNKELNEAGCATVSF